MRRRIGAAGHAARIHLTTRFTGPEAMAAIDLLVMPSRYEAMSYVMLEAAAAGKPLILTDVGGASTVLKDDENGILLRNGDDPRPLADAMAKATEPDRLARYTAAAIARAQSPDYSLERMVSETEAIYRGLVA